MPAHTIIGLGRMGSAIAARFAAQGQQVTGWTRSGNVPAGITPADDLASAVAASPTLVLSLYDDHAVAEVLDGLLGLDLTGKLIIETSTVSPVILQDRAPAFAQAGAEIVDAPISGGPELVAAGRCGIFVGGEAAAADRAQTQLTPLTERVFHIGPLGSGLVMKTINNTMLQCYFAGLDDMMPLAARAGILLETALQVLCGGPAGLPMLTDRLPKVLGQDQSVGFATQAVLKDNAVFQRVAAAYGTDTPSLALFAEKAAQAMAETPIAAKDIAAFVTAAYARGASG